MSSGSGSAPRPSNEAPSDRMLRLCIPPDPRYVRDVREALEGFTLRHNVAARDTEMLLFAVGEALANAVEHAESKHDIEIQCRVDENEVVATIIDSGRGIGKSVAGDILPLPEPLAEGGRGIPIMQRCTDIFAIRRLPGGGTAVVLGLLRRVQENSA